MIRKLSDFQDEDAIRVVGKLLKPVCMIVPDERMKVARTNLFTFASALLEHHATDVKEILAVLSGTDVDDYHCTAESVFADTIEMLNDGALLQLFGLQTQTPTSSVSATENSEVTD